MAHQYIGNDGKMYDTPQTPAQKAKAAQQQKTAQQFSYRSFMDAIAADKERNRPGRIGPKAGVGILATEYKQSAAGAQNRGQLQANGIAQQEARGRQLQLADMLMQQAQGKGPSIAQAQLQIAADRNMANAMAMGLSQRGPGAMAQMKSIQDQRSAIGQQQAADSALLRLQEQMQARGMLGQQLGQMRGQDQNFSLANLQAGMQQRGLNDQMSQFYTGQRNQVMAQDAKNQLDWYIAQLQAEAAARSEGNANKRAWVGAGTGAVGAGLGLASLGLFGGGGRTTTGDVQGSSGSTGGTLNSGQNDTSYSM